MISDQLTNEFNPGDASMSEFDVMAKALLVICDIENGKIDFDLECFMEGCTRRGHKNDERGPDGCQEELQEAAVVHSEYWEHKTAGDVELHCAPLPRTNDADLDVYRFKNPARLVLAYLPLATKIKERFADRMREVLPAPPGQTIFGTRRKSKDSLYGGIMRRWSTGIVGFGDEDPKDFLGMVLFLRYLKKNLSSDVIQVNEETVASVRVFRQTMEDYIPDFLNLLVDMGVREVEYYLDKEQAGNREHQPSVVRDIKGVDMRVAFGFVQNFREAIKHHHLQAFYLMLPFRPGHFRKKKLRRGPLKRLKGAIGDIRGKVLEHKLIVWIVIVVLVTWALGKLMGGVGGSQVGVEVAPKHRTY